MPSPGERRNLLECRFVKNLEAQLDAHTPFDAEEARDLRRVQEFVSRHKKPFDRAMPHGHLVGSALVVSADGARVLLLHHRKLDRWLQAGGHAEPHEGDGAAVALREAREETGIDGLRIHPQAPGLFDVDVHRIPARGADVAHDHLDLRYLVLAPADADVARSLTETNDARWFTWSELEALDLDHGLRRLLAKARAIVNPA